MDGSLINKNYINKVIFLNREVVIIKLSKDISKGEVVTFNLAISIKVITRNNRLQNTYQNK